MDYWRDGFLRGIGYWIYDLQTLIAGMFALATLVYMWGNGKDDKKRKLWHAKSAANFAVSELHSALVPIINSLESDLVRYRKKLDGKEATLTKFSITKMHDYPKESIKLIASLIPVSEQKEATKIAELISLLQVYQSRLNGFVKDCNDPRHTIPLDQFYERICEQIELANWIDRLFPYVRDLRRGSIEDFLDVPSTGILMHSNLFVDHKLNDMLLERKWPPKLSGMG